MDSAKSRIRMMTVATLACVGLCVAIWFVTPPPPRDGCATGAVRCDGADPFCLRDPDAPHGICTRLCPASSCPDGWCCVDHLGSGDPAYFVCAPPSRCPGSPSGEGKPGGPH